jgi:hypothetical protein
MEPIIAGPISEGAVPLGKLTSGKWTVVLSGTVAGAAAFISPCRVDQDGYIIGGAIPRDTADFKYWLTGVPYVLAVHRHHAGDHAFIVMRPKVGASDKTSITVTVIRAE